MKCFNGESGKGKVWQLAQICRVKGGDYPMADITK